MNFKYIPLFFVLLFSMTGCSGNLVDSIYDYTRHGKTDETAIAFIALSNINLTENELERIINDYAAEDDDVRKYYYEYLLSKRTQEKKYILKFIENSNNNTQLLKSNPTRWVSIESPFYKLLSIYSRTSDEALKVVLGLSQISDGAYLSVISSDVREMYMRNPERITRVASGLGIDETTIKTLIEEE